MEGTLYLCATPIGNLDDITFRVLETLKQVDLIAAEDTRHSIKLLNHFDIHTPMTSYHEYNKVEKARVLVEKLKSGMNIACITDAGTPGISDPGEELVRQCCEAGIKVTALPGAVACVTALIISGLPTRRFCFEAFLPTDKKEHQRVLAELQNETRTIVLYEAIPVWSGLSKYIIYKSNVEGAAGTRVADKAIVRSPALNTRPVNPGCHNTNPLR